MGDFCITFFHIPFKLPEIFSLVGTFLCAFFPKASK